jgi:SAM-dependent methyltransferase
MSIVKLTSGLTYDEHGIWVHGKAVSLSYPKEGNLRCFGLEDTSFWFGHRNDCIIAVIKRFPPNGAILDVGGGNGYVIRRILDEGFEAVLLEPGSIGALNGKTRRHIPEVICSTLEDACFLNNSLDAIGCFDVIEHIQNDQSFIEQVYKLLKPGGLLYATVPAHQWLWSLSDNTAQHYRRYNRKMIVSLLDSKFELVFHSYFFGILALPIFFLRILPFRLGILKKDKVLSSELEHGTGGGFLVKILKIILEKEYEEIRRGKKKQFGTSCLFVARKVD